jgi:hypothetical protein
MASRGWYGARTSPSWSWTLVSQAQPKNERASEPQSEQADLTIARDQGAGHLHRDRLLLDHKAPTLRGVFAAPIEVEGRLAHHAARRGRVRRRAAHFRTAQASPANGGGGVALSRRARWDHDVSGDRDAPAAWSRSAPGRRGRRRRRCIGSSGSALDTARLGVSTDQL